MAIMWPHAVTLRTAARATTPSPALRGQRRIAVRRGVPVVAVVGEVSEVVIVFSPGFAPRHCGDGHEGNDPGRVGD
jgi:hypothetical protein